MVIPIENMNDARTAGQKTAEDFIRNSSTFKFDGLNDGVFFIKDDPGMTSSFMSWSYNFAFECAHPGYGDRSGQFLAQMITKHTAIVIVNLQTGKVFAAVCDNTWDMIHEVVLPVYVSGMVVGGGDTTAPGGSLDAPRTFTYKLLKNDGTFVYVSYIAYPPSPAGDTAKKFTLEIYNGSIQVGDLMDACGVLNTNTNTVNVTDTGNYIRTSVHLVTVTGVVVSVNNLTPPGGASNAPLQYLYELIRDDGTFIKVNYTINPPAGSTSAAMASLYNSSVQPGDYMKAVGTYDKETNTVVVADSNDMIKTYPMKP